MSISEDSVQRIVIEILRNRPRLSFEELRDIVENVYGIYIDGLILRKIISNLIIDGTICKTPSMERKKLLLTLCSQ